MNKYLYFMIASLGFLGGASYTAVAASGDEKPRATPGENALDSFNQTQDFPTQVITTSEVLQMVLALGLVLGILILGTWLLRRVQGLQRNASSSLKILGGVSLGTRERMVLVQVGEQQLLLGVCPGRIQTLHVLETPIAASQTPPKGSFAERLNAAMKQGETP